MKTLHSLRPALPYDDLPLLTAEIFLDLRNNDHTRGTLHDIWIEGGEVLGVWQRIRNNDRIVEDSPRYIVKMSHNYREEQHRLRWIVEDLAMFRRGHRIAAPASYYLDRDFAMETRPNGEITLFPEEANVGEIDDADDDNEDFDEGDEDD